MAIPKLGKMRGTGPLVGYARVCAEEQGTDPQLDELRAAGCGAILEEHASGVDRSRLVLARLLREIRPGETPPPLDETAPASSGVGPGSKPTGLPALSRPAVLLAPPCPCRLDNTVARMVSCVRDD